MAYDVVVVGSGAAGLTAALRAARSARVGLFEKTELLGGTSSISGGAVWIPNNHLMSDAGLSDSPREALSYLESLASGSLVGDVAESFVRSAGEMLRFVESASPCRFRLLRGCPDYHPEAVGGCLEGRSLEPHLFNLSSLGGWAERIRCYDGRPRPFLLSEMPFGGGSERVPDAVVRARMEGGLCGMGEALVGSLLSGCLAAGVSVHTEFAMTELCLEKGVGVSTAPGGSGGSAAPEGSGVSAGSAGPDGSGVSAGPAAPGVSGDGRSPRVAGVRFVTPSGEVFVRAKHGVILATGGFEWNKELVRSFLRGPMLAPAGVPSNVGDGLTAALEAGAELGNTENAWWAPMVVIPGENAWGAPRARLMLAERTRPGSIMVDRAARRFCNEASDYNSLGEAFHRLGRNSDDPADAGRAWLIFDRNYERRGSLVLKGRPADGGTPPWIHAAADLEGLGTLTGLPPEALQETVREFNRWAAEGKDPAFGRGDSAYDRFNGDRTRPGARAALAPLENPPYYALEVCIGTLGTSGGPRTDARGRVLSRRGGEIPGLWAAGNVMAAPTGSVYGGAGGTLGPAMTFGYLAGGDAAQSAGR